MGASVWWNSLSDNYKDVVSFLDEDLQDLYGFELYYNYQIMPSVNLTADIQYVQNEGKTTIWPLFRVVDSSLIFEAGLGKGADNSL